MTWHHMKNKKTGREQFAQDLSPINKDEWEITVLDREPTHLDHFDPKAKKLIRHQKREREHHRHLIAETVSKADLIDMIYELQARVDTLEKKNG